MSSKVSYYCSVPTAQPATQMYRPFTNIVIGSRTPPSRDLQPIEWWHGLAFTSRDPPSYKNFSGVTLPVASTRACRLEVPPNLVLVVESKQLVVILSGHRDCCSLAVISQYTASAMDMESAPREDSLFAQFIAAVAARVAHDQVAWTVVAVLAIYQYCLVDHSVRCTVVCVFQRRARNSGSYRPANLLA